MKKKKRNSQKLLTKKVILLWIGIIILYLLFCTFKQENNIGNTIAIIGMDINEVTTIEKNLGNKIEIEYEYSNTFAKDKVINYLEEENKITLIVSLGKMTTEVYEKYNVNELGNVPIMMYHGIVDMKNSDTPYTGGNVDKDGYTRTSEAFRADLEFYYQNDYRMIRLNDYVDGIIDVELGKSPIILTFDDGNKNNFKVLGKDENGQLIIDPNSAIGILEEFKKKYPDYGVTATFFVNSTLFNQSEYNEEILNWLVTNGYDVGNHTMSHVDLTKVDQNTTREEIGGVYQLLDSIIKNQYVNIVALPFGSPYKKEHENYSLILDGSYNNIQYHTKASLRVGWEAEVSCFAKDFDPQFLKRIRAYDNDGSEFDIEMNFKLLETTRYISDGNSDTIVVKEEDLENVKNSDKKIINY